MTVRFRPGMFELAEIGHYRLTHKYQSMDGLRLGNTYSARTPFAHVGEMGLPIYATKRCGSRACWACQYRARGKLRDQVSAFVDDHVRPNPSGWRFVTLTLPGSCYDVRSFDLEQQFKALRKAFRSWRMKMQRRNLRVSGFYTIEVEASNGYWHCHIHMIMPWKKADYTTIRKLWVASVDRQTLKTLESFTDGSYTNAQRTLQVDAINSPNIAGYLTKVTNYVTKVKNNGRNRLEIPQALYRARTTGWLGEHHGAAKKDTTGIEISTI